MVRPVLRILVIGSGGREHAISWALNKSHLVERVFCTPGNAGTQHGMAKVVNCDPIIEPLDFEKLVDFAKTAEINLVLPCSEAPIIGAIFERLHAAGIPSFCPSKQAARLEGSKVWAKNFMARHGIPAARYQCFTNSSEAIQYIQDESTGPVVIKASGLAAGKGVIMPKSRPEAVDAIKTIMIDKIFGEAGNEIVIEELLHGHEISITVITDGRNIKMFPVGQDAQRILEGNHGANTGGMGVYAPTPLVSPWQLQEIEKTILQPTIDGMREEGIPFTGFICVGLMMTDSGPKLIEYNARFGDPEAQTLLPLMDHQSDLAEVILACTETKLGDIHLDFVDKSAVSVVLAANGYPGQYETGMPVEIGSWPEGLIFHAGTRFSGGRLVTSGGRVLSVVCVSNTLEEAIDEAYRGTKCIEFEGKYFRNDIGKF